MDLNKVIAFICDKCKGIDDSKIKTIAIYFKKVYHIEILYEDKHGKISETHLGTSGYDGKLITGIHYNILEDNTDGIDYEYDESSFKYYQTDNFQECLFRYSTPDTLYIVDKKFRIIGTKNTFLKKSFISKNINLLSDI